MKRREFMRSVLGGSSVLAAGSLLGRPALAQGLAPFGGGLPAGGGSPPGDAASVSYFHATFESANPTQLPAGSKFNLGYPNGHPHEAPSGVDRGIIVTERGTPFIAADRLPCLGSSRLTLPAPAQIIALPVNFDHSAADAMTGGYIDNSCYIGGSPATPAPQPAALTFSIVTQYEQGGMTKLKAIDLFRWRLDGSIDYRNNLDWTTIGSYLVPGAPWIHFRLRSRFENPDGVQSTLTLERIEFLAYAANGDCFSLAPIGLAAPDAQTFGGDEAVIGGSFRIDDGEVVVDEFVHMHYATSTATGYIYDGSAQL